MAKVLGGNQVKLNNGRTVTAQTGGWYDGRQFWNGSLSSPGQIHSQSDQQGAGKLVSREVNRQSSVAQGKDPGEIERFLASERRKIAQQPRQQPRQQVATSQPSFSTPGDGAGVSEPRQGGELNLPELFQSLQTDAGISKLQGELSEKEKAFTEATGVINDNPFLSEATRVGRVRKLDELFQQRTANLRDDIATKQADVETQLNLQLKQFELNSEQVRQAWDQFNTLLGLGALNNASGQDIANITRGTGISSGMIQSAIASNKRKNVNSKLIQIDDGTNISAVLVNADTGEVMNKTVLSASKPKVTKATKATTQAESKNLIANDLRQEAQQGTTLRDIFRIYTGFLEPNEILQLYNANSIFGTAKETPKELASFGVKLEKFEEDD